MIKKLFAFLTVCFILTSCSNKAVSIVTIDEAKLDNLLTDNETYYLYFADRENDETIRIIEMIKANVKNLEEVKLYLFDLSPYREEPEEYERISQKYGITHSTYIQKRQGKRVVELFVWSSLPENATPEEIKEIRNEDDARLLKFFENQ